MRLCAVSVDLDEVPHYHGLHGLPPPEGRGAHVIYDVAIERCFELAREHAIPLTFFAVASDLARDENAERLRRALELGHEIGNHTHDHFYDLTRRSQDEQGHQIAGALDRFEARLGVRPLGFRAPGYTVTDELLAIVARAGHRYDSSVFPSPPYYAAKALAFVRLAIARRRSRAIFDGPRALRAPTRPYRLGEPYYREGRGIVEFPIQVTRGARLPYIGTALVLAGRLGARALTDLVLGEPFINLELHGIDFAGKGDGIDELIGHQPDARIRAGEKLAILGAQIERIRRAGYRFVRLDEAALSI
jgi:hypothetical protein